MIMPTINYLPSKIHDSKKNCYVDWYIYSDEYQNPRQRAKLNRVSPEKRDAFADVLCKQIDFHLAHNEDPWEKIPFLKRSKNKFGKPVGNGINKMPIDSGFKQYLSYLNKINRRKDTVRSYKSMFKIFEDWIIKNHQLKMVHEIKENHVREFFDYLLYDQDYKIKSYNNILSALRSVWKLFFVARFATLINPFEKIDSITTHGKKIKTKPVYSPDQLREIKTHIICNDKYFWAVCAACFYCYIRRTEITRLKIKNFDFKNGYIIIHEDEAKDWTFRNVKIPHEFHKFLLDNGYDTFDPEMYFISNNNFIPGYKPCVPTRISNRMRKHLDDLKIDIQMGFYDLKHSGIFYFRENHGGSKEAAKEQAGHDSDKMHYTYYKPSDKIKQEFEDFSIDKLI